MFFPKPSIDPFVPGTAAQWLTPQELDEALGDGPDGTAPISNGDGTWSAQPVLSGEDIPGAADGQTPVKVAGEWTTQTAVTVEALDDAVEASDSFATKANVSALVATRSYGLRTVVDGDSNTENGGGPGTSAKSWRPAAAFPWANRLLGGRLSIVRNAAVGGQTSTDMLARQATHVLAYNPDIIIVGIGTNDSGTGASPAVALATTQANILAYIDAALAAGVQTIVVLTDPPRNGRSSGSRSNHFALQAWKRTLPTLRRGVVVADIYSVLADPAATDTWRSGYAQGDNTHFWGLGGYMAGNLLAATLNPLLPALSPVLTDIGDPTNKLASFAQWAGAGAGVAPSGWTASNAAYISGTVASDDDVPNPWLRIVIPDDTTWSMGRNGDVVASTGNTVVMALQYRFTSPEASPPSQAYLRWGINAAPDYPALNDMSSVGGSDPDHAWVAHAGVMLTPPLERTGTMTQFRPTLAVNGGCTLDVRCATAIQTA